MSLSREHQPENTPVKPLAVVTGASSGIGAATARRLATDGFHVIVGARRRDRLDAMAAEIGGTALTLDVTEQDSVDDFARAVDALPGHLQLLVNNAGGAKGQDPIENADPGGADRGVFAGAVLR